MELQLLMFRGFHSRISYREVCHVLLIVNVTGAHLLSHPFFGYKAEARQGDIAQKGLAPTVVPSSPQSAPRVIAISMLSISLK